MKYSVGYQLRGSDSFVREIVRQRRHIKEVYFSWGSYANGRNSQLRQSGMTPWEAQTRQERDLQTLSEAGLELNLLFNAMCYGKHSQSRAFFEGVGETVDYIRSRYTLSSVTTTSLLIAKFLKDNFEKLDIRASVNIGIGTACGLDYVKDYFDSFYVARELNRDLRAITELKEWCDRNGKTLYGLANSGCLNHCSAHVFHDNLVAHEAEISQMDNGYAFEGVCAQYLKNADNLKALLENTSYIRPEDVGLYEDVFPAMKLATRVSNDPVRVLRAYINRSYRGSTLDLLEPNHTGLIYPYLLENCSIESSFKDGRLIYTGLDNALIKLEDDIYVDSSDDKTGGL